MAGTDSSSNNNNNSNSTLHNDSGDLFSLGDSLESQKNEVSNSLFTRSELSQEPGQVSEADEWHDAHNDDEATFVVNNYDIYSSHAR
jgi:hypothetical protein